MYNHLFAVERPDDDEDYLSGLNPKSIEILTSCKVEPRLTEAVPGNVYQFERLGYFCVDSRDSKPGLPVFNRTVTLRDSWAKIQNRNAKSL